MHVSLWGFCDEVSAPQNRYALFFFRMSGAKRNGSSTYAGLDAPMQSGLAYWMEFESC
jgi:hypothetical protein